VLDDSERDLERAGLSLVLALQIYDLLETGGEAWVQVTNNKLPILESEGLQQEILQAFLGDGLFSESTSLRGRVFGFAVEKSKH